MFKPNYSPTTYTFCRLSIALCTSRLIIKISLVLAQIKMRGRVSIVLYTYFDNLINLLDSLLFLMRELEFKKGETTWLVINGFEPNFSTLKLYTYYLSER